MSGVVGINDPVNPSNSLVINSDGSINVNDSGGGGGGNVTVISPLSTNSGVAGINTYIIDPGSGLPITYSSPTNINTAQINAVTVLTGTGAVGTGAQRVAVGTDTATIAGSAPGTAGTASANVVTVQGVASMTPITVQGDAASGASVAGNPLLNGGRAATANPTAVADGQAVAAMFDKEGKQVAVSAIRTLKAMTVTTITSSTAETTIVAQTASVFNDLYGLILANSSASATTVTIKDSTSGTTRAFFEVPAGDTRGFMLDPGGALPQATVNTNWTATCGTSVASLTVSAFTVANI